MMGIKCRKSQAYYYDKINHLTAESRDGEENSYIYNLCGNHQICIFSGGKKIKENRIAEKDCAKA